MSGFKPYPAYKDSGVEWLGEVPEHWVVKQLRYLGRFRKGLTITKADLADTGIPCLNYGEVHSMYPFEVNQDIQPLKSVPPEYLETDPSACIKHGDFVFADTSEDLDGVGNFTHVSGIEPLFAGYHTIIYSLDSEISSRFLAYCLDSFAFRTQLRLGVKGVKVFSVTQEILRGGTAWLPTTAEQTQIARFLDHETARIDALIKEQQRLIELLKEKRQAVISHAVTKGLDPTVPMKDSGVEWLGEVPAHWDVRKFYFGIKAIIDNRGRSPSYIDSGIPILEARQLSDEAMECSSDFGKYISEESHSEFVRDDVAPGDVLMVTVGTIGKVGVVGENPDYVILQNIVGFRVDDDIVSGFMGIYLKSGAAFMAMQATNKESILSSVKVSDFIQHKMPLPPLAEQKAIVRSVNASLSKYGVLQKEAELLCSTLHERRSALISAAVTGKIDVRGWQPQASAPTPELAQEAV